jgi:putative transposase
VGDDHRVTRVLTILGSGETSPTMVTPHQRLFARLELNTRPDGRPPRSFGRFEAEAPNDRWTGDALHGPVVAGRKTYLFAFIDDHSRALVGYRWGHSEDTVRLEAALRAALAARGVPKVVYVDNGSAFVSGQLLRALASLGIALTHSKPGQPAGRGKIERLFRTVREQFLVELGVDGVSRAVADLTQLNELFAAWVETVYHARVHSETGQTPRQRFLAAGAPALPTPQQLHEAFLWSQRRTVTKTATISLHGNSYEVDAALVGRQVEVVFDPFDLTRLDVRYQGRPMGLAVPHRIGRHVHPDAHPDTAAAPAPATGIDYLALVAAQHRTQLAQRISYTDLSANPSDQAHPVDPVDPVDLALEAELASFAAAGQARVDGELPGQLALTDLTDLTDDDEPGLP